MDRILVVVFDSETKACEGKNALLQLDDEGRINFYANVVLAKHADGTPTIVQDNDRGPVGTLRGTELGSLVGTLGGLPGLAIGTVVGMLAGNVADRNALRTGEDFVQKVAKELRPNRFAVVAEVEEESTAQVDICMERIGGVVFRFPLAEVKHAIHDEQAVARKARHAQARAERKAELQKKMSELDSRLQAQLLEANDRREAAEWEAKAKAEDLERKAEALGTKTPETHV